MTINGVTNTDANEPSVRSIKDWFSGVVRTLTHVEFLQISYLSVVVEKNERRNYTENTGWTHNEVESGARRQFHACDNMIEWRGSLGGQSYELVECRNAIHHVARPWRIDGEYANRLNRERENMRKEGKTERRRARGTGEKMKKGRREGKGRRKTAVGPCRYPCTHSTHQSSLPTMFA